MRDAETTNLLFLLPVYGTVGGAALLLLAAVLLCGLHCYLSYAAGDRANLKLNIAEMRSDFLPEFRWIPLEDDAEMERVPASVPEVFL